MKINNKRKNILIIFILVIILFSLCYVFVKGPKRSRYFVFDENTTLTKYDADTFYVDLVSDENTNQRIYIDFEGDNNMYIGSLYVPGTYKEKVKLCWNKDEKIHGYLSSYKSNEYIVNKEWTTFYSYIDGKRVDFLLFFYKTSENIDPLFINIDESLGTIEEMNNDYGHEISCYGQAHFNNEDYHISIKGRGNSTWRFGLKKPYNITFTDENYDKKMSVSMIEGIETKKWSLLANYDDPTLLRNKIGYDLANTMSIGIDSKYYDVWMNGEFLGNYLITPKNDYQATEDGFILELDNEIDNEDPQFKLKNENGEISSLMFTVKNNDAGLDVKNIQKYMQKAWEAVMDLDSDEYLNYFDIESWASAYLLNELFKNYDIVNGSILMHKDSQEESSKLIYGPVWDLDNALGTLMPNSLNGLDNGTIFSGKNWYIQSVTLSDNNYCLLQQLGKHDEFMNEVIKQYGKYKNSFNTLIDSINEKYTNYSDSFIADYKKWGNERTIDNYYNEITWTYDETPYSINYKSTNNYNDYLDNLLLYVNTRTTYLNDNINEIKANN